MDTQVEELQQIAEKLNVSRNAVIRFAVDYFLKDVEKGKVDPAKYVETVQRLKSPKSSE